MLPLSDHQQGPSTSQSGPYLRDGAEKIRWISPLPLLSKSQTFLCTCTKIETGALRPLMVIKQSLWTPWAQRGSISLRVQTLTGYSPVFTGIVPKVPGIFLSIVLNELTKAPFEPMKDTDLAHLTLKTPFLLALASGKRRSEIHTWVANKVSNLGQWEKVALFPSSDFIAKNQLAGEGSQGVCPVESL